MRRRSPTIWAAFFPARDGTVLAITGRAMAIEPLIGNLNAKFDGREFSWLADNKISILFQMGLRKHPDLPAVPLITDFARPPEDRQVFEFLFAPQDMGRPFFAPPGVPAERVQALRDAFERTLKDAQFLAEADRLGLEVQHGGGDAIDRLLERIYATPKTVIERVKAFAE
jgi:hypothetical protein